MKYKDIQSQYKKIFGRGISTCAIADSKRKLGYVVKKSKNRINKNAIQKAATENELKNIETLIGRP